MPKIVYVKSVPYLLVFGPLRLSELSEEWGEIARGLDIAAGMAISRPTAADTASARRKNSRAHFPFPPVCPITPVCVAPVVRSDFSRCGCTTWGSSRGRALVVFLSLQTCAKEGTWPRGHLVHDPLMPCQGGWEPCTVTKSVANR